MGERVSRGRLTRLGSTGAECLKILSVEGAQRRFNRRAETRDALAHAPAQQSDPDSRPDKELRHSRGRRTAGVSLVIQFGPLAGRDFADTFCSHLPWNGVTSAAGRLRST